MSGLCYNRRFMGEELLLRGGTIVTASETFEADLLVRDGRIASVGQSLSTTGEIRDVSGLSVMPGGIDTHVHLEHPVDRIGIETADDFFSGSIAAACGGTTTLVDFALQRKGDDLERVSTERAELAGGKSIVDFGLHIILTDIREETPSQMRRAVEQGFTSFKIYMTYADKYVDDASLLRILETNAACGGLTYLHCENDCAVTHLISSHLSRGDTEARFHAPSRPSVVEAEATYRAIALAEITGAPICIAHVTSERALGNIEKARYEGAQVVSETCPQYLLLTDACYHNAEEAAKYVCTPPIRSEENQRALWQGLRRGSIQQVASDHAPFRFQDQKLGPSDFTKIPNGVPGIETRLALLYSKGVSEGRLSPNRFVQLVATNPAKMFGLYPRKGSLAVGADADIVVMDPGRTVSLRHDELHHDVDYTPYEGMDVTGVPVMTVSRGRIVSENGQIQGDVEALRGRGELIARKPIPSELDLSAIF